MAKCISGNASVSEVQEMMQQVINNDELRAVYTALSKAFDKPTSVNKPDAHKAFMHTNMRINHSGHS
jgi:NACalpha-BTF3-like transcription factor